MTATFPNSKLQLWTYLLGPDIHNIALNTCGVASVLGTVLLRLCMCMRVTKYALGIDIVAR